MHSEEGGQDEGRGAEVVRDFVDDIGKTQFCQKGRKDVEKEHQEGRLDKVERVTTWPQSASAKSPLKRATNSCIVDDVAPREGR